MQMPFMALTQRIAQQEKYHIFLMIVKSFN
jgi:hypothetical protein